MDPRQGGRVTPPDLVTALPRFRRACLTRDRKMVVHCSIDLALLARVRAERLRLSLGELQRLRLGWTPPATLRTVRVRHT